MEGSAPIPEPPGWPIFGNSLDIDPNFPMGSIMKFVDQYGEIFRLRFPGRNMVFVTTQALVHELCDESRFQKGINASLVEVRNGVHDGLFTARLDEPNWALAHRVLMPAFGPMPIQSMFDEMHEIATQLTLKWARHGPDAKIAATDDFTRLTLDTIALCSMGFRFNSFYHDEMHPFVDAMGRFLTESGARSQRPAFLTAWKTAANKQYWDDIAILRETAEGVIHERKQHPTNRRDLLTAMLEGVDPKTGDKMSDASIVDNLITFLIAGHETTSGMLGFAFYQMLKHPETLEKARQEVDTVIGTGPVRLEHMNKLPYIAAVLRETLRLSPTIPVIGVQAKKDTIIGGKYAVQEGQPFALFLAKSQLDPTVFGETVLDFIPDRMLDDNFDRLNKEFPDSWKPFGNGQRACIGRPFAWQEAILVMAMLLQNLEFSMDDPEYQLQYKQTLTVKPKGFYIRAKIRNGMNATELGHRLSGGGAAVGANGAPKGSASHAKKDKPQREGKPLSIYYGSNSGTCEALAQRLAADATLHGYSAAVVSALDAAKEKLPQDHPVAIITASYEGLPPDNAAEFYAWTQTLKGNELEKVSYAVFGCGHHDWAQTFHRIPRSLDDTLEARGASRLCAMGLTDAAQGQMFTDFEQWEDEVFWPALEARYGAAAGGVSGDGEAGFASSLSVQFSTPRSTVLRQDVQEAVVVDAKTLTAPSEPNEKRHLEVKLPDGVTYRPGDYLAVLPINALERVGRVMRRFHIAWDAHITIEAEGQTNLPTGTPVPVYDILASYVELAQPATKRGILALSEAADADPEVKQQLQVLTTPSTYTSEISRKRVSILDLLERFPSVPLPFEVFLSLLPPMRIRQYSISSSPLRDPARATLTYSLLSEPSLSNPSVRHTGVASSYLASLQVGDKLAVSVRKSHTSFHLPSSEEAEKTPIICIAAGTGLAPFRGFIQDRAAQIGAGRTLAPAVLFFGCRGREDDLYRDEFDRWEAMGAVSVRRAYSRFDGDDAKGCKHVQDRLWLDRAELTELWERGSRVYVCGSRAVGESVKDAVVRIAMEARRVRVERGESDEPPDEQRALRWFESIRNERYATDVFD